MTRRIFVTGTDTDVGKTFICKHLAVGLTAKDIQPVYWKPVQSGTSQAEADYEVMRETTRATIFPCVYEYETPASPDQAASAEHREEVNLKKIRPENLPKDSLQIIEGAGGIFVPLNTSGQTWLDWLQEHRPPTLIVARSGLGTLNHTLLTVHALHDRGLEVAGVVLNGPYHPANEKTLRNLLGIPIHCFPQIDEKADPSSPQKNLANFVQTLLAPNSEQESWNKKDADHVWHPYTQHKKKQVPIPLTGAKGSYVITAQGERLIDASASWWVNTIGHGREEIRRAIASQQAKLDHSIYAGACHEPGARLAGKLANLTGNLLSKVFYSDNGSTAVEVGLKMAYQSCHNRGLTKRNRFLALKGSYHGDTFGTMAAGDSKHFHGVFSNLLFETDFVAPFTSHKSLYSNYEASMKELTSLLEKRGDQYAAFLLEPMVQGAGGMLVHDTAWLREAVGLCREHGIPIVLDEVFTGMGRLGANFAFMRANIQPDIICIAKGLTGGTLPFAATIASKEIYEAFLSDDPRKALMHGHSFAGNPIGCAAALATLDIFEKERLTERSMNMETRFTEWLKKASSRIGLCNERVAGGILAFEVGEQGIGDYYSQHTKDLPKIARAEGLLLRTLGNTVYLVPPLTLSEEELSFTLDALARSILQLQG